CPCATSRPKAPSICRCSSTSSAAGGCAPTTRCASTCWTKPDSRWCRSRRSGCRARTAGSASASARCRSAISRSHCPGSKRRFAKRSPERSPTPGSGNLLSGRISPRQEAHMHVLLVLAAAATMNDPQIATVALTAHQIDVDRGKLALKHTHNDEVKQFAEQMVHDHQAGIKEAMDLAKRLGVKPEQSDTSKSLKADAGKVTARLKKEKGAA